MSTASSWLQFTGFVLKAQPEQVHTIINKQSMAVTTQDLFFAAMYNHKGPKTIMLLNLELSFK